jgi:hypothetical protein
MKNKAIALYVVSLMIYGLAYGSDPYEIDRPVYGVEAQEEGAKWARAQGLSLETEEEVNPIQIMPLESPQFSKPIQELPESEDETNKRIEWLQFLITDLKKDTVAFQIELEDETLDEEERALNLNEINLLTGRIKELEEELERLRNR